jgi:hypothetical protein
VIVAFEALAIIADLNDVAASGHQCRTLALRQLSPLRGRMRPEGPVNE